MATFRSFLSALPALLCFACTTTSPDHQQPLDAGEWRNTKSRMYQDLALQCLQAKDHERAQRLLQQAVQYDAKDAQTLELLMRLSWARGDVATADGSARLLLAARPESIAALCTLGAVHETAGRFDDAERCYRDAIAKTKDDPRAFVDLHRFLLARGRGDEAAALRQETTSRFPRVAEPHLDLASDFAAKNQWDDARRAFDAALDAKPDDAAAATGVALSSVMSRRPEQALALAERMPPHARASDPSLLLTLAAAHLQTGDYSAALRELDLGASSGQQERAATAVLRGEVLYRTGDLDAAKTSFERAIALEPEASRAHAGLGRVYARQRNWHAAARCLERAVSLQAGNGANHALLATALAATGDRQAAARHAARAKQLPGTEALLAQFERLWPGLAEGGTR